jgi:Tfp pilus assembly protein PilF
VDERQRIRVVNNMGAYLLHESQPAAAYEHFRRALREIVAAPDARSDQPLLRTVLENLGLAAEQAKMAEARFYRQLSRTIKQ